MYATILVWLLISSTNDGDTKDIAKFKDQVQCEHVRKHGNTPWLTCVQANIVRDW